MAANGRCFTSCCVAALRPDEWQAVHRTPDGTPAALDRVVKEDELARGLLLKRVLDAGMPGGRVGELVMGEYAEAKDMPFFSKAIGGSIAVVPPNDESGIAGTRHFGHGPLKMKAQLYYLAGRGSPISNYSRRGRSGCQRHSGTGQVNVAMCMAKQR